VLNSDGDIRFIKPDGDCDSKEPESPEDAGLSRPVLLLSGESDPLPLWLTSVVMELNREGCACQNGAQNPGQR